MKCRNIQKDLIFYSDKELLVDRNTTVRNHLENCVSCRGYLAFLESELSIISEEKNKETTPFFYTRLSARLEVDRESGTHRSWSWLLQPALFTLVLLLGIYGGIQIGENASSTIKNLNAQSAIQIFKDFESEPIELFLLDIL
jgi:predicted anti-sigma-YlaC factor YlaD